MKISGFYFLKLAFLILMCFLAVTTKGQAAKSASSSWYAEIVRMDNVLLNAFSHLRWIL